MGRSLCSFQLFPVLICIRCSSPHRCSVSYDGLRWNGSIPMHLSMIFLKHFSQILLMVGSMLIGRYALGRLVSLSVLLWPSSSSLGSFLIRWCRWTPLSRARSCDSLSASRSRPARHRLLQPFWCPFFRQHRRHRLRRWRRWGWCLLLFGLCLFAALVMGGSVSHGE